MKNINKKSDSDPNVNFRVWGALYSFIRIRQLLFAGVHSPSPWFPSNNITGDIHLSVGAAAPSIRILVSQREDDQLQLAEEAPHHRVDGNG